MKEICPACGAEMKVLTTEFALGDGLSAPIVNGVEHCECPSCGEITFNDRQMLILHGYRLAQRQFQKAEC